jgi:DNA primase
MAGIIPQSFIDDLLERVDIVEVIDSRVKLKKTGKNYSACCPFHDEKTPSFSVSPDKQFFYCFGCGASGNSIGFVMDYERISFPEAIDSLAKVAGVDVPRETKTPQAQAQDETRKKARKALYQLMEQTNDFYQQQLREHEQRNIAVNYLKNRGLSGHIAKDFGIGYAPAGWDNLIKQLGTSNERQDLLIDGGLLIKNDEKNKLYDRFRERIMFPIRDSRGRVIGFGGRVLNDEKPKYLNSPETTIFHKGKELYGLYEAKEAYRQLPRVLVVEGYMDVIALAQYGIRYGVATLGTACSTEHLTRAFRFTNEVVFCFDGDEAGRKAARRAMENALPVMEDGRQIKFLYLPDGEDPDTLIRQIGDEKFTTLIESASPLESFLFEELGQHFDTQTMEGRARLCKLAAPMLDQLPRGIYRELMFQQLSNRTGLSREAVVTLLSELPEISAQAPEKTPQDTPQNTPKPIKTTYYEKPKEIVSTNSQTAYTPEQLALAQLLSKPTIANSAIDIEALELSQKPILMHLCDLLQTLQQTPEMSSSQLVGHWSGKYGQEAGNKLAAHIETAMRFGFYHQNKHCTDDNQPTLFNIEKEFADALQHICNTEQQQQCDTIIQQLDNTPRSQWSDAQKQLYLKAINARAN